jgi:O-succinylbenzoic acid--CoA ligase
LADGAAVVVEQPLLSEGEAALGAPPRHDLSATAVVIHTSGTSSAPRPVELSYGNLLWSALGSAVALGLDPQERWLCALPLSHVGGLSILVRSTIYATTAVVHERFETERVLRALREQQVTLVSLVATTLTRLLDAGLAQPPALRAALTGGGPVPAGLVRRAHRAGVRVSSTYGLTETCSQVTTTPAAALADGDMAAGPALFCTRVRCQADGEIVVAGPTVAAGALAPDGWLHTGDLGVFDPDGYLRIVGRIKDMFIVGGFNAYPAEIEGLMLDHPDLAQVAIVGVPDARMGEVCIAFVVPTAGHTVDPDEVLVWAREHMANFKVPRHLEVVDALPLNASGKVLKFELRERGRALTSS